MRIECHDGGYVRLVDHMGTDLSVVRSARVSHNAAWRAGQDTGSDARLINYLYNNNHNTPFESVEFQFEVRAPIFVVRQWMRHRTWSYNEVSARYTEVKAGYYIPNRGLIGMQDIRNKQGRSRGVLDTERDERVISAMRMQCHAAFNTYEALLKDGVPRELARTVLPVSMYTTFFCKVDLSNLFKFLTERLDEHAQYEIRVYAEAILRLIEPIVPVCVGAYNEKRLGDTTQA